MTLEAQECIRRFLLPIVPHGFQRLRQGFWPTGVRHAPCARVDPCSASRPIHLPARNRALWSGCGSGLALTSPHVPRAATVRWCGVLCIPDSPGSGPRGVREGAALGLVMIQHWTWPLPRGRRSARASLAPRDQCVSAASGGASAGHVPSLVLSWGLSWGVTPR